MRFLNRYQPPAPLEEADWHASTPAAEYDLNFCYELPDEAVLQTEGVRLVPLVVRAPRSRLCAPPG